MAKSKKSKHGFASLPPERHREIARMGGLAAHQVGTAHQFTSAEARAAGIKGGATTSANREHMSRIGRLGAQARTRNLRKMKKLQDRRDS